MSALLSAPLGLRRTFPDAANIFLEGVLLPIAALVTEFIDSVGFFEAIFQCPFDPAFAYLAYFRSEEVEWESLWYLNWYPYVGQMGVVLDVPAQQVPSKNRSHDDVALLDSLSHAKVVYRTSDLYSLSDE